MTQYSVRMKLSNLGEPESKSWESGYLVHAEDPIKAEDKALETAAQGQQEVHKIVSVKEFTT